MFTTIQHPTIAKYLKSKKIRALTRNADVPSLRPDELVRFARPLAIGNVTGGISVLAATCLLLTGCTTIKETIGEKMEKMENQKVDYKTSRELPPLEAPPGLVLPSGSATMEIPATGSTTYSEYASGKTIGANTTGAAPGVRAAVLPQFSDIRVMREGDSRWLLIKGEPARIWSRLRDFWIESGFTLTKENPTVGVMETDWAENRNDIPTGMIRSLLGKFADSVYSSSTRDKFRVRLERGQESGTTELYLTHQGAEEVSQGESFVWQARDADSELEAEMLNRIMASFGVQKERARAMLASGNKNTPDRAKLIRISKGEDSMPILSLQEDFSRAWRRTGLALDRAGFTVEDRDRSRGLFYVRYVEQQKDTGEKKEGWLSKMKFWGGDDDELKTEDEYLIRMREQTATASALTYVQILNKEGKPELGRTAEKILTLLHKQLK